MKISIGNDHAGYFYKNAIVEHLQKAGYEVSNHGTDSQDSVDYPDFAHLVASDIDNKKSELGILICGSGNGVAITANKHKGVRAAICWKPELAQLARQHNNANIISIPARFVSLEEAVEMVEVFLNANFEGGRHLNRVNKINL